MIVTTDGDLDRCYLVPEDTCTDEEVGRIQRAISRDGVRLHNRVTDMVPDLALLEERIRKHLVEDEEDPDLP